MTLPLKLRLLVFLMAVLMVTPLAVRAQVPVVPPQEPGPDGGLVHVVEFGDTLDGILNAYINLGVTMESLLELNGWRFRPQFIYVNDQIIVLPPGSVEPGNGLSVPAEAAPPPATPVPQDDASQSQPDASTEVEAAPALQVLVLNADQIGAMNALQGIAPFVPILGDASALPPPPSEDLPEAGAAVVAEETTVPVAEESPASEEVAVQPTATEAPPTSEATPVEGTPASTVAEVVAIEPTPTQPVEIPEEVAAAPEIDLGTGDADMPDFMTSLGQVCATFYDDINQNGRRDTDEAPLTGGLILLEEGASVTSDEDGVGCLVDLGAGSLIVQAAAPDGYGITSPDALRVQVAAGQTTNLDFGASAGYEALQAPPAIEEILSAPVPESFRSSASEGAPAKTDESPLDQLYDVSGLIALAAGILVFSGGMLLALWLRLVRA